MHFLAPVLRFVYLTLCMCASAQVDGRQVCHTAEDRGHGSPRTQTRHCRVKLALVTYQAVTRCCLHYLVWSWYISASYVPTSQSGTSWLWLWPWPMCLCCQYSCCNLICTAGRLCGVALSLSNPTDDSIMTNTVLVVLLIKLRYDTVDVENQ